MENTMNRQNQNHPGVAVIRTELTARIDTLDRQRTDSAGRIHDAEVAVLAATKALHAAKDSIADIVERKRAHERAAAEARGNGDVNGADSEEREVSKLDALLLGAVEHERACDVRRRQALVHAAHLKLEVQAARYQECIAHIVPELFQAFVDEAERFAQVYQATERQPLLEFDAAAVALRALNVQMKLMAGQRAPILAQETGETSSVVTALNDSIFGRLLD
jgi:hypothetical protein